MRSRNMARHKNTSHSFLLHRLCYPHFAARPRQGETRTGEIFHTRARLPPQRLHHQKKDEYSITTLLLPLFPVRCTRHARSHKKRDDPHNVASRDHNTQRIAASTLTPSLSWLQADSERRVHNKHILQDIVSLLGSPHSNHG